MFISSPVSKICYSVNPEMIQVKDGQTANTRNGKMRAERCANTQKARRGTPHFTQFEHLPKGHTSNLTNLF